ncbi:glycosyltransferase [Mesorhizobium sp. ASY16-5R]|uniref:glycosyltransferase n=1 Tax=Mesorhizobium sp. ASY16-5R TaxID=3445772 RepID=UPI003FA10E30
MSIISTSFGENNDIDDSGGGNLSVNGWSIITQDAGFSAVLSSSQRGLELSVPSEAKNLHLQAGLPIPIEASGASLQLSCSLYSQERQHLRKALAEIAVFRVNKAGRQAPLLRVFDTLLREEGVDELRVEAAVSWPLREAEHIVSLRFRAGTPAFTISRIVVSVASLPVAKAAVPVRRPWPSGGSAPAQLRAAVVTWEVGDNPFGRAHALADMILRRHGVEILGSAFTRPGQGIWAPLRDTVLPVRSLPGAPMSEFVPAVQAFVEGATCDIVHLSKYRFPGMLMAMLLKHRLACPVVLDLDDRETAFFPEGTTTARLEDLAAAGEVPADLGAPNGAFWTGIAEGLIPTFEDRTVVNKTLGDRFGGLLVRHARDETVFCPDPVRRQRVRSKMQLTDEDRVVLFAGTPRRHKGLARLLAVLDRLADPRLLLVVAGTIHDRGFARELAAFTKARVKFLPDLPFSELSDLLQSADGVCLLQDKESPISEFQTPAKLSDALALGIPVAMSPVPSVADAIQQGLVTPVVDDDDIQAWLLGIAEGRDTPADRQRRLDGFDAEFSYGVNCARIERAFSRALSRPVTWNDEWTRLFREINRRFGSALPEDPPAWARKGAITAPALRRRRPIDLVCFWKQNDTGIYGRRHDMLLKYLRQSEQVGTIVQFDAPVRVDRLRNEERAGAESAYHHGKLIADATARRFLEIDDKPGLVKRTFVYGREPGVSYLGRSLPRIEDYQSYVADTIARHCSGNVVGWAWPVAPMYADIAEGLGFDLSVVDLVDDQRVMVRDQEQANEVEAVYRQTLAQADLVFANCGAVGEAFAPLSPAPIHVVPNACEFYAAGGRRPRELEGIDGPIIGYVGNLRSRVDVTLLDDLIGQRPSWTFVVIGSAHGTTDILGLRRHPNLRLLGPKVYEEALAFMRCFDVAIMPHLHNAVSERMNPLKLYVYVALGLPVVATDVANMDDLRGRIDIAGSPADFLSKLDSAVARRAFTGPHQPRTAEELWPISWPKRVADMLDLCKQALKI